MNYEAIPASGPPDLIIEFIRTADTARLREAFFQPPSLLFFGAPVLIVVALILWLRGTTLSAFAFSVYCSPALLALVCFASEFHSLGAKIGLFHGHISELGPFFGEAFARLYIGILLSVALFVVAALLHSVRYARARFHPQQPTVANVLLG